MSLFFWKTKPAVPLTPEQEEDASFKKLLESSRGFEVSDEQRRALLTFKGKILLNYESYKGWEGSPSRQNTFAITAIRGTTYKERHYFFGAKVVYAADLPNAVEYHITFPLIYSYEALVERLRNMHQDYLNLVALQEFVATSDKFKTPTSIL